MSATTLTSEQIRQRYNRQAEQYKTRQTGLKGDYYRRFEDNLFLEYLKVDDKRVLDLGTGRGRLALLLADRAKEIVGIDLSDEMIRAAKEAAVNHPNVSFERADAAHLRFPDQYFDVVSSVGMFPYIRSVYPFFQEINRVLVPGGLLAFSAFNADEWQLAENAYVHARRLLRRLRTGASEPVAPASDSPLIPHERVLLETELARAGFTLTAHRSTFFFVPSRLFYWAGSRHLAGVQTLAARTNQFLGRMPWTRDHGKVLVLFARKVRSLV